MHLVRLFVIVCVCFELVSGERGYSMLAYVASQQGAQKLSNRTKGGCYIAPPIPVDGYPFNKGMNRGREVFVNVNLFAHTHRSLNAKSDKDAVTRSPVCRRHCTEKGGKGGICLDDERSLRHCGCLCDNKTKI